MQERGPETCKDLHTGDRGTADRMPCTQFERHKEGTYQPFLPKTGQYCSPTPEKPDACPPP